PVLVRFTDKKIISAGVGSIFSGKYCVTSSSARSKFPFSVSIVVLVVIIIAYAVGVEHGKGQVNFSEAVTDVKTVDVSVPDTKMMPETSQDDAAKSTVGKSQPAEKEDAVTGPMMEYTETMKVPDAKTRTTQTVVAEEEMADLPIVKVEEKKVEMVSKAGSAASATGKYTVQLMSIKKETAAKGEVEKLKKAGKNAAYSKKGDWYSVYLQGYKTADEANKAKKDASSKYPDCYVRRQI
ncbi:MAG TPA: SPOR domain-containing protein, partial [Candidatus Omnitrophota bacterium]|nr:SPOR domain-containing protein [Candidatus Omnitrophota bacterium]